METCTPLLPPGSGADEVIAYGADEEVHLRGSFAHKRFRRSHVYEHEARVLRQLPPHPCLIHALHADDISHTLSFRRYATDLMRSLLADTKIPAEWCCLGLASAVAHCHRVGLVHRDIKPENVLLEDDMTPILCDFSRALFAPEPMFARFSGTKAYAAPEAKRGHCCMANDIWSLGVVFFCIVETLFPFDSDEEGAEGTDETPPQLEYQSGRWDSPFEQHLQGTLPAIFSNQPDSRPCARSLLQTLRQASRVGGEEQRLD